MQVDLLHLDLDHQPGPLPLAREAVEVLGFVAQSTPTGMGPYPRYGRVVRTEREAQLGPPAPADHAGAQTRAILSELGRSPEEIATLFEQGIVGAPD